MIKLSKENLVVWKFLFTAIIFTPHILLVIGLIVLGVPFLIVAYAFIVFFQFYIMGIWRLPLLKDVYLDKQNDLLRIVPLYAAEIFVPIVNVVNYKTKGGITSLWYLLNDEKHVVYFKAANIEDLHLLKS